MKLSMEKLQQRSSKYERTYLDEIRRRYESGEDWTDVMLPLLKGIGARMRKCRKPPTPFSPVKFT